jgi:predicted DNA-binding WGR domain protein
MARFYTMTVQPTLFGEWALQREWGRIGSAGRLVSGHFASEREAALAMAQHLKAKLSKGYEAV